MGLGVWFVDAFCCSVAAGFGEAVHLVRGGVLRLCLVILWFLLVGCLYSLLRGVR